MIKFLNFRSGVLLIDLFCKSKKKKLKKYLSLMFKFLVGRCKV